MQRLTEITRPETEPSKALHPWILSPVLDYLFCCGGMMWLLFAIEKLGVDPLNTKNSASVLLAAVIAMGSLFITEAHGPATLVRAFASKTTPNSVKVATLAWAAILLAIACLAMTSVTMVQIFTKITLVWLIQHYTAQTYGIIVIYCIKRNYKLEPLERLLLQWLLRSLMLYVTIRMFTYYDYGHLDNFLGLDIPFYGPLPIWCLLTTQLRPGFPLIMQLRENGDYFQWGFPFHTLKVMRERKLPDQVADLLAFEEKFYTRLKASWTGPNRPDFIVVEDGEVRDSLWAHGVNTILENDYEPGPYLSLLNGDEIAAHPHLEYIGYPLSFASFKLKARPTTSPPSQ